jgi:hypothetical protein
LPNVSAPFGFRQQSGNGSAPTFEQVQAIVDYNTANIFLNDPVFRLSDGSVAGVTTGPGPGTAAIAGIFAGCKYPSVAQKRTVWGNYWPGSDVASTNAVEAYLINDPSATFLVQAQNSAGTGFVQADIGLNAQFIYGTGNTANGLSGAGIDITVARAVTSTLPFRVLYVLSLTNPLSDFTLPPGSNGTFTGAYNYAIVGFNNVETKALTATN